MAGCIKNCGKCPFFESFLKEYEDGVGVIEKGRCHKWNEDEIWETRTPCNYAETHSIEELERDAFQ